ncbi:hypothetical protein R1C91_28320, partial [Escherichia coli]
MTWELILDGYSESSYSATPRFAAARLPWFIDRNLKPGKIEKTPESESPGDISRVLYYLYCRLKRI